MFEKIVLSALSSIGTLLSSITVTEKLPNVGLFLLSLASRLTNTCSLLL